MSRYEVEVSFKSVNMKLQQVEREKEANTLSYRGILNRMEEARLSSDESTTTITIVEKADLPKKPMSRGVVQIVIVGLFLGVAVGVAVVLMLDKLEDKIISPADIEKRMRLKILALLPHVAKTTREQLAVTVATKKFSQMTEAFAGLRALLESPRYQEINRCVLVISTQPEEGKTISVCNLALSYAQSGLKTLLVDFDMRRPRIARIFGVVEKAKASLLHVLEKGDPVMFPVLPVETEYDRLHVVVSKAAEEISPADIMGRRSVKDFLEWAKANYDRVIIDSPPFGLVSDSVVVGQLAGAVVIVCRLGKSRYHPIVHAVREFRHADCKVIGAIINDVRYRGGDSHYDYRRY
jgi:capsular exopolysaccharide synthesis family protein